MKAFKVSVPDPNVPAASHLGGAEDSRVKPGGSAHLGSEKWVIEATGYPIWAHLACWN